MSHTGGIPPLDAGKNVALQYNENVPDIFTNFMKYESAGTSNHLEICRELSHWIYSLLFDIL